MSKQLSCVSVYYPYSSKPSNRGVAIGMANTGGGHLGGHGYIDAHYGHSYLSASARICGVFDSPSPKERYRETLRLIGGKDVYGKLQ